MPFIRITVGGAPVTATERSALQERFTAEIHKHLRKRREVTAVAVESLPPGAWAIDGVEMSTRTAHVEMAITAGTNTPEEKASMIAAADRALREILGTLPEATYAVIQEIAADAWGYNGKTQQTRAASKKL